MRPKLSRVLAVNSLGWSVIIIFDLAFYWGLFYVFTHFVY